MVALLEESMEWVGDALETKHAQAALAPLPFAPDTPEKVDWLLRLLFELQARSARALDSAKARAAADDAAIRHLAGRYATPLLEYLGARLAEARGNRKKRSVHLDEGALGLAKITGTGEVRIENKAEARAYAESIDDPTAPALGCYVYELDERRYLARARKHFEASGECMPGCAYSPPTDTLYAQAALHDRQGRRAMKRIPLARIVVGEIAAPEDGASLETEEE